MDKSDSGPGARDGVSRVACPRALSRAAPDREATILLTKLSYADTQPYLLYCDLDEIENHR